jgi:hypothetical protein
LEGPRCDAIRRRGVRQHCSRRARPKRAFLLGREAASRWQYDPRGRIARTILHVGFPPGFIEAAPGRAGSAVEGHADERGGDAYNLHLGEERAEAVQRCLARAGVERARLSATSRAKASSTSSSTIPAARSAASFTARTTARRWGRAGAQALPVRVGAGVIWRAIFAQTQSPSFSRAHG